jgi:hypothetical protein
MNANLALAAQRLQRASHARSLFIGQRDKLDPKTLATIDHQLVQRVTDLRAAYIADGGTEADADAAIKAGDRQATAYLEA